MEIDRKNLKGWPLLTEARENTALGTCLSEQNLIGIGATLAIFSRGFEYSKGENLVRIEFDQVETIFGAISVEQMIAISKRSDFDRRISFSILDKAGREFPIELPYKVYNDFVTLIGRLISSRKRLAY